DLSWTRHGECAHAPAPDPASPGLPEPAALLQRGTARSHPRARRRTGRPFLEEPARGAGLPAEWVRRALGCLLDQPRERPREPPRTEERRVGKESRSERY